MALVTAVHYTGMAGMYVTDADLTRYGAPEGAKAADLVLPLIVGLFVFPLICSLFLLLSGDEDDREHHHTAPRTHPAAATTATRPGTAPRGLHGPILGERGKPHR